MTAWEIKQMEDEEIIGFHRKLPPFKAKRMDWRNSKLLKQRQQIPAPELLALPQLSDNLHRVATKKGDIFLSEYVDPDKRRTTKKRND